MAGAQSFIVLKCRLSGKTRPRRRRNNFFENFFEDLNGHLRCPKNTDRQFGSMRLSLGLNPAAKTCREARESIKVCRVRLNQFSLASFSKSLSTTLHQLHLHSFLKKEQHS